MFFTPFEAFFVSGTSIESRREDDQGREKELWFDFLLTNDFLLLEILELFHHDKKSELFLTEIPNEVKLKI